MSVRLFHVTSSKAAREILRSGFKDGAQAVGIEGMRGVWLSDRPLDANEGITDDTAVLAVTFDVPLDRLAFYELVEDDKPYREWCIPASVIAQLRPKVERVGADGW
jgi:hypothetical protein